MKFRTKVVSLALLASMGLGLMAQPALAADETNPGADTTSHDLVCNGADCELHIDFGEWQAPLLWRYGAPILVDNLQGKGQLPSGTALTINDDLTLSLPMGDLRLLDTDLHVTLDTNKNVRSFRGTARVPFPSVGLFENLQVADPLRADVGFDYGANLTWIDAPLDPEARYFFFDFGSGVHLDGTVQGGDGAAQSVSISTPRGQRAVVVVEPLQPLLYIQGHITINHLGSLAFMDTALTANGIDAPGFDFASLPGRTSMGVTALLTDDPALSYLEVSTGSAIDGGPIARWIGVDAAPVAIDGVARLDHTGLRMTGVTRSSILPATVWDGRGQVEIFVPFEGGLHDAYVATSGTAAVPIAAVKVEGDSRLALPPRKEKLAVATVATSQPGLWARTTSAVGEMVGRAGDAAAWTGDVVGAGAGAAWNATANASKSLGAQAAGGAAIAWDAAWSNTVCRTPGVQGLLCDDAGDIASEAVASR